VGGGVGPSGWAWPAVDNDTSAAKTEIAVFIIELPLLVELPPPLEPTPQSYG